MKRLVGTLILTIAAIAALFTNIAIGQCGTYFHPDYRAIGKDVIVNDSYFRLDDWNGDGRSDYWNFQPNGATSNVVIYPGKPTGYWDWDNPIVYTTTLNSATGMFRAYPNVLDFDGDGDRDLRFGNRIYRNTGTGSLEAQAPIAMAEAGSVASSGLMRYVDITGDGRLDWLYSIYKWDTTREIRYQPGMPDGSFGNHVTVFGPPSIDLSNTYAYYGDYNGDARLDFMLISGAGQNMVNFTFVKGVAGGTFETGSTTSFSVADHSMTVFDMNTDGRLDILVRTLSGHLGILHAQADGSLVLTEYPTIPHGYSAFGDLNGDGRPDIFKLENFAAGLGYGGYRTILNDGVGGYVQTTYNVPIPLSPIGLRIEDVSGDGKPDVFEYSANARDSSAGHTAPRSVFGQDVMVIWTNVCQKSPFKIKSMDSDRRPDVVMWDPNSGQWSYRGSGWSPGHAGFVWGTAGDVPAPGDFDGDGIFDFSVYRESAGTWYTMNSASSGWWVFRFGLSGDKPVPNDYDGDGRTDIAVFRPSDGTWHIWLVGPQQYQVMRFGLNGDRPVPGDYDGDFKDDIGVYRPSDGTWYWVRSSDQGIGIQRYGIDTDIPIPADYDGDGKTDLAVYRSGAWYVQRSTNGVTGVFNWGTAGDIPVPTTMDDLYTSDLLVYRPSNRTWYGYIYWPAPTNTTMPVIFGRPTN